MKTTKPKVKKQKGFKCVQCGKSSLIHDGEYICKPKVKKRSETEKKIF